MAFGSEETIGNSPAVRCRVGNGNRPGPEGTRIPKGFRPKAQGCEERATLGMRGKNSQPQRGCGHVEKDFSRPFRDSSGGRAVQNSKGIDFLGRSMLDVGCWMFFHFSFPP